MKKLRSMHWIVGVVLLSTGIGFGHAAQCPTVDSLKQDSEGYWTANDEPGWKSVEASKPDITIKEFGGVVYSPEKKRIACVYKDSTGKWVPLISSVFHPFEKDDLSKNWKYDEKDKDWSCGAPDHSISDCQFEVKK